MITEIIRYTVVSESLNQLNKRFVREAIEIWDDGEVEGDFRRWISHYCRSKWLVMVRDN